MHALPPVVYTYIERETLQVGTGWSSKGKPTSILLLLRQRVYSGIQTPVGEKKVSILVRCPEYYIYSGAPLIQTPMGQKKVSILVRYPEHYTVELL